MRKPVWLCRTEFIASIESFTDLFSARLAAILLLLLFTNDASERGRTEERSTDHEKKNESKGDVMHQRIENNNMHHVKMAFYFWKTTIFPHLWIDLFVDNCPDISVNTECAEAIWTYQFIEWMTVDTFWYIFHRFLIQIGVLLCN